MTTTQSRPADPFESTPAKGRGAAGTGEGAMTIADAGPPLLPKPRFHPDFPDIVAASPAMMHVLAMIERVAPTDAAVMITGETGTGKELIARAIHARSERRAAPLVCINCPTIPASLAESELFGHERGAFTGALEAQAGQFELADGGTIFLDEIGDLPLILQVKLLRVLQEGEVRRIGGRAPHKVDFRVVAATNRDLAEEIRLGRLREDLYWRLAAFPITLPSLRQRDDDVFMLAGHFLRRSIVRHRKRIDGFSPTALAALGRYHWPGNVRELQHIVERAVLLCPGDTIEPHHLSHDPTAASGREQPLRRSVRDEQRRQIQLALDRSGGNQAAAARLLGISRSNLNRMIKNLGMPALRSGADPNESPWE